MVGLQDLTHAINYSHIAAHSMNDLQGPAHAMKLLNVFGNVMNN